MNGHRRRLAAAPSDRSHLSIGASLARMNSVVVRRGS
jgi:hypothetical protein